MRKAVNIVTAIVFLVLTWNLSIQFFQNINANSAADEPHTSYSLEADDHGQVLKTPDGRTVLRYMTKKPADSKLTANSVCCLFPLNTPSGERVVDFAPGDHPHHRGVFLAWHAMDAGERADFWGWGEMAPTSGRVIENRSVELTAAKDLQATIAVQNDWMADDKKVIDEQTTVRVRQEGDAYLVDLVFRLTPTESVTLDRSAFGGFCVKARKDGEGVYADAAGPVEREAPHHLKPETDWPSQPWYDYTITLQGDESREGAGAEPAKQIGVTVIDHPQNPPTMWHNLKSIAMINPCIVAPAAVTFTKDEPLELRYRLVVHDGPLSAEAVEKFSAQWRGE